MPGRSDSVPSLVPLAVAGCHHSSLPSVPQLLRWAWLTHSLRGTSRARLYKDTATDAQTNKTSFFFLVISTVLCVQPRSTLQPPPLVLLSLGRAPAGSWVACGTRLLLSLNTGLPPMPGFARKRPPCRTQPRPGLGAPLQPRSPPWCQALPALPLGRAQLPHISSWHCWAAGWGGGQLPLPSSQKSILMKEPAAGSAGWPGLPEGTAPRRALPVLRVR